MSAVTNLANAAAGDAVAATAHGDSDRQPVTDSEVRRPLDPAEAIPVLRERIDELDAQIVNLVRARAGVSRRIQAARVHAGGTRVELGRERVVLQGYRDLLGPDGALLGDAVLRVCRGARQL